MRFLISVLVVATCMGCERITYYTAPTPAVTTTTTNTNTNTNTTTTTVVADRADTDPPAAPGPGNGNGSPLPLPTYGESVTRDIAAANPGLLANSCQDVSGDRAWEFLDLVIRTLRSQDQRWGYLCKDAGCLTFARDVVAYKAGSTDTGIWIVDVIGNHCPGPNDSPPQVRWGVLPFETVRRWAGARLAGVFP